MTVSPEKIAEMLAAAEKATPGPWGIATSADYEQYIHAKFSDGTGYVSIAWEMRDPELNYLVHLDPQTVTAILSELLTLRAERDEARELAEWWKKCDWWEGGQHDYHRSRAARLEAGLLKLRPGDGTDAERLAAIEQETGLSFTPKLTEPTEPHPALARALAAEAQLARQGEALKPFAALAEVRYPDEGGAPSFIDIMTQNGEQDELELRSFTAASEHIEILHGEDFRNALRARSTLSPEDSQP